MRTDDVLWPYNEKYRITARIFVAGSLNESNLLKKVSEIG